MTIYKQMVTGLVNLNYGGPTMARLLAVAWPTSRQRAPTIGAQPHNRMGRAV